MTGQHQHQTDDRQIEVSFNFDDVESGGQPPLVEIHPQEIARDLLRARVDWIRLKVTNMIEVHLWKGDVDFLVGDLVSVRKMLGSEVSGRILSYWNDGELNLTCTLNGDMVTVDIVTFTDSVQKIMSRSSCLFVWNRMAAQFLGAVEARRAALPPMRQHVDLSMAKVVKLRLNFDHPPELWDSTEAFPEVDAVVWYMERAGIQFVDLQLLDDASVILSTGEFTSVVNDIGSVQSFLENEDMSAYFSYWGNGAIELSYASVGERLEIDIQLAGPHPKRFRRVLTRSACLAVWFQLVSKLRKIVEGSGPP